MLDANPKRETMSVEEATIPNMWEVAAIVEVLVRKRWVTKRRLVTDTRVVHLRLSRRDNTLALQIDHGVRKVEAMLTEHDGCALSMNPKGRHA
ncbi:MAG TPA: hypothetical protein VGQ08_11810 [Nitrospiraceae bacterium]|jgi:hypothetical protein|nr:hypothetical protein [Nitrospiraceae bacterium]